MVSLQASPAAFEQAANDFRRVLDAERITGKPRFDLELIFEEIVTNAIRYGFRDRPAGTITASLSRDGNRVTVVFEDDGAPFDPLAQPDPAPPATLEQAIPGGLGLLLVRRAAASAEYERTPNDHNRLRIAVDLTPAQGPPPG